MSNRKKVEAFILDKIAKLIPGDAHNVAKYKSYFASMDDAAFETYMKRLQDKTAILSVEVPNLSETKISIDNNFELADELKHKFLQRLWLTDPADGTVYLTPIPYLVIDLPLRRQQQMLTEKRSIPDNNRHVDELTGQPTGDSHSSSLTFPELQNLYAHELPFTAIELIKFRGGDTTAFQRMNRAILETGGADQDAIQALGKTRPKSTETLSVLMTAAHIANNI